MYSYLQTLKQTVLHICGYKNHQNSLAQGLFILWFPLSNTLFYIHCSLILLSSTTLNDEKQRTEKCLTTFSQISLLCGTEQDTQVSWDLNFSICEIRLETLLPRLLLAQNSIKCVRFNSFFKEFIYTL